VRLPRFLLRADLRAPLTPPIAFEQFARRAIVSVVGLQGVGVAAVVLWILHDLGALGWVGSLAVSGAQLIGSLLWRLLPWA
jgi:hypothetical protein